MEMSIEGKILIPLTETKKLRKMATQMEQEACSSSANRAKPL